LGNLEIEKKARCTPANTLSDIRAQFKSLAVGLGSVKTRSKEQIS